MRPAWHLPVRTSDELRTVVRFLGIDGVVLRSNEAKAWTEMSDSYDPVAVSESMRGEPDAHSYTRFPNGEIGDDATDSPRSAVKRPRSLTGPASRLLCPLLLGGHHFRLQQLQHRYSPEYIGIIKRNRDCCARASWPPLFSSLLTGEIGRNSLVVVVVVVVVPLPPQSPWVDTCAVQFV